MKFALNHPEHFRVIKETSEEKEYDPTQGLNDIDNDMKKIETE